VAYLEIGKTTTRVHALCVEIDEAQLSRLSAAKGVPFETPARSKTAVKVINDYGGEVLKVYPGANVAAPRTKKK
jgi:hypothetical protein